MASHNLDDGGTPSTLGGEGQSQSHRDRQSNRLSEGELEGLKTAFPEDTDALLMEVRRRLTGRGYDDFLAGARACSVGDLTPFGLIHSLAETVERLRSPSPQRPLPDEGMREKVADLVARLRGGDKRRCPFDGPNTLAPTDPCPVCGDLGTIDDDELAVVKCVSTTHEALHSEAADLILALLPDQPPVRPGAEAFADRLLRFEGQIAAHIASVRKHVGRAEEQFGECSYLNWIKFDASQFRSAANDAVTELRRLLDLSSRPDEGRSVPEGWRDIETAPKDGTPILAWCVHPHARWATDDKDWCAVVVTQWINHNGGGWTWYGMTGAFTHWMPLPPPPYETGGEG